MADETMQDAASDSAYIVKGEARRLPQCFDVRTFFTSTRTAFEVESYKECRSRKSNGILDYLIDFVIIIFGHRSSWSLVGSVSMLYNF